MILKYFNIWWQAARRLVKVSVTFISKKKHKNVRTICPICFVLCCCCVSETNALGSLLTVRKGFKRFINKKPNRLFSLNLLTLKIFPRTFHTNFTYFLEIGFEDSGLHLSNVYKWNRNQYIFSFYYPRKRVKMTQSTRKRKSRAPDFV